MSPVSRKCSASVNMMAPGPIEWTASMCPPAPSGPTACVRQPRPSEKCPSGRSGFEPPWVPADARGCMRQAQPLVQAVGGLLVQALQIQGPQNHVGLGREDAERKVVEVPLAAGRP